MNAEWAGVGAVLVSIIGMQYPLGAKIYFNNSNNTTEYKKCILGLKLAQKMGIKRLAILGILN